MGKFLKSILFSLIIFFGLFNFQVNSTNANNNNYFIVTAYYSPLPNQKKYITGSYSGDKRLNGEGHTTASGKPVKPGILAAPSKYPFGTKIYFEGYGVGVVEDRGGAIVKAGIRGHEHDRIDIWMGYGDEGLQRALKWGKRTISGRVIANSQKVNLKFAKNMLFGLEKIKVNPEVHKNKDVVILQEKFKELGLYNGKIDGNYDSIKNSIINFQLKNKIINSKNDDSAGWFGPKTYLALLRRFSSKEVLIRQDNFDINETNPKIQIILNYPEIKLNGDNPQTKEVKKVQDLFKKLGLYSGKVDGDFKKIKRILLNFQKKAGIIKYDNSWGAGYFGEKTKAALIKYFENKNITKKKKLSLDDISYSQLKKVGEYLKKSKSKKIYISKLEKTLKYLRNTNHKNKISYLINIIKS